MATFTFTGISITYDFFDDPVSVAPAAWAVTFPTDQVAINYSVMSAAPGELPVVDIDGPEAVSETMNGQPFGVDDFGFDETLLGQVTTTQGSYVLLALYDSVNNIDYLFKIGGDPFTIPATAAEFEALRGSITSIGVAGSPFAPGQNIALSSLQNVTVDDSVNFIIGTDGDDDLVGTPGDDMIITGNATSDGDYVSGSTGNDTIDMSDNDGENGYVVLDYGNLSGPVQVTADGVANTGTVTKQTPVLGTDTLLDVANPLDAGGNNGGLGLRGTVFGDSFDVTVDSAQWVSLRGGGGADTYTLRGDGLVRLDFRDASGGIIVNLDQGRVGDDGYGNAETIGGALDVFEVRGSAGDDIFVGSDADERYRYTGGNNIVDGAGGYDMVRYDSSGIGSVSVDLAARTGTVSMTNGQTFTDSLRNIEAARGTNGDDDITGDAMDNRLEGRSGNDRLNGGDGDDWLEGQAGNDTIDGGDGFDTVYTHVNRADATVTQGAAGEATIVSSAGTDVVRNVERLVFRDQGFDIGTGSATSGNDTLTGTANDDTIDGLAGDDAISGGDGNDSLSGGDGNDTLDGEAGNDTLDGGGRTRCAARR